MFAVKFNREGGLLVRGLLFMERMTFRAAQVVLTTNESHKRIAQTRGRCRARTFTWCAPHRTSHGSGVLPRSDAWHSGKRHSHCLPRRDCRQDGVDHLVRAMKILRDEHGRSDIRCVFMGGGPHQPAIAHYADELGLGDCCTFAGHVSDETLCRVLSSADIGVDPGPRKILGPIRVP